MTSFYSFRAIEHPNYETVTHRSKYGEKRSKRSLISVPFFWHDIFSYEIRTIQEFFFVHRGHLNGFILQFSSFKHASCDRYDPSILRNLRGYLLSNLWYPHYYCRISFMSIGWFGYELYCNIICFLAIKLFFLEISIPPPFPQTWMIEDVLLTKKFKVLSQVQ